MTTSTKAQSSSIKCSTVDVFGRLQIRMNPGMVSFTKNNDGYFGFNAGAHGGSYEGICNAKHVAKAALMSGLITSEIIQKLTDLGWNDVIEQLKSH